MDATGSMYNLINKLKTSIQEMYEKAEKVLKTKNIDVS